jgi:hypothetical protein
MTDKDTSEFRINAKYALGSGYGLGLLASHKVYYRRYALHMLDFLIVHPNEKKSKRVNADN